MLDYPVPEVSQTRIQHILAGIVANVVLHKKLSEPNILPAGKTPAGSLIDLINQAETVGVLVPKQASILRAVNKEANDAKHSICS